VTIAARPRRTQEQRSAQMRARLLDATIECLVKYGYAGTTTPRVAEMAGVTRGAQVHHFGSKNELVLAALKHLAAKRTAAGVA
jgi:AcrR family transcriptional regulator